MRVLLARRFREKKRKTESDDVEEESSIEGDTEGLRTTSQGEEDHVFQTNGIDNSVSARGQVATALPERSAPAICDANSSSGNAPLSSFSLPRLNTDERFSGQEAYSSITKNTKHPTWKQAPVHSGGRTTHHVQYHHLSAKETRFRDLLKKNLGLEIKEQEGDGNCLFRAISLQVYGDPSMHGDVRKQCMDHMVRRARILL